MCLTLKEATMAAPKGHLAGGKFTSSHTTVIDVARKALEAVAQLDCVNKIALAIIKSTRGGSVAKAVKITEISTGLQVSFRGPRNIQEVFVYTSDPEATAARLKEVFNR